MAAPTSLSYATDPAVYATCGAIADNTPTVGGGAATSFSIAPALPAGLSLDASTGVISGTPTAAAVQSSYTITASNAGGSVQHALDLTVSSSAPTGLSYAQAAPSYTMGFEVASNSPSLAAGAASAFAVTSGTLPDGLELDPASGVISGTPLFEGSASVTVSAINCEGLPTNADLLIDVQRARPRGVYATNPGDETISVYAHDPQTGMLRPNGYVHTGAGSNPIAIEASPDGRFVYAASDGALADAVLVYAADEATGRLTPVESETANVADPVALAVHPLGAYVYVLNAGGSVAMYAADPSTGALSPLSTPTVVAGIAPSSIALAPDGGHAYVSNAGSNDIDVFAVGAGTGLLSLVEAEPAGAGTSQVVVSRDGTLAFASNEVDDTISCYAIDALTGELVATAGSPFALTPGSDPRGLAIDPSGDFLYTADAGDDTAGQLAIGAGGILSAIAPFPMPVSGEPVAIAVEPSGTYVYVVCSAGNEVRIFDISGALDAPGVLAPAPPRVVRARALPSSIAFQPSVEAPVYVTTAVYVPNFQDDDVTQYATAGGLLTALAPTQVQGGVSPNWIDVHPTLDFAYAANSAGATGVELSSVFSIGASGELVASGQYDGSSGDAAWSIHLDPSGRFAFLVLASAFSILPLEIDQTTGALTAGTPVLAGAAIIRSGAVHPTGKYFYIANQADQNVGAYAIDAATGALTPLGTAPTGVETAPFAVAVDPSGRFAYAACRGNNDGVACFTIDAATGALAPLAITPFVQAGIDVVDLAISPSSRFLYAANYTDGTVTAFLIGTDPENAAEDGALFSLGSVAVGGTPGSVRFDAAGTTLYVGIQAAGGGVEAYSVDSSGVLTLMDTEPTSDDGRGMGLAQRMH